MAKKTNLKIPKKEMEIINHYIGLLQNKIKIKGILLFGSYVWGNPSKHSDIDLAIISPDFNKKEFSNRLQWLSRMRDDFTYQTAMDIIGYTPKEFTHIEKHSAIMARAKKYGKWIYQKNCLTTRDFA